MSLDPSPGSGSSSPARPLARGQACMPCRWRKIRCDGVRPTCGQCAIAQARECHYDDASTSHASNLQKTVNQLEARIRQLEQGGSAAAGSSTVFLHDPYTETTPLEGSPLPSPSRPPSAEVLTDWPSSDVRALLIETFFQHVQCLPWFLHEGRYRQALTLPDGDVGRPIVALDAAVLFWGNILRSRTQGSVTADTGFLVGQASSQVGTANVSGPQAIQVIQARLLLADYLLDNSLILEGRAHLTAATSLTFRLRLHKIRSGQTLSPHASFLDPITIALPEPRDAVEEGERIRAFWSVFSFGRAQAVVFAHHKVVLDSGDDERRVDTPWPLDMSMYEHGQMPPGLQNTDTLRMFLEGVRSGWPWDNDILTILAKASALFERTANIATVESLRESAPPNSDIPYAQLNALDQRVDELEAQLAPLTAGPTQKLHLSRSLVLASRLQLHSIFTERCPVSRAKCLAAARAIWETSTAAGVEGFVYLDSVIGWIWATACRVIMNEIVLLRAQDAGLHSSINAEGELMQVLDGIFALMTAFAARSSSMNYQLSRIEQEQLVLG